ncbi:MAG: hypothetical protein ACXVQ0_00235 [Actinomycetota bacterium]
MRRPPAFRARSLALPVLLAFGLAACGGQPVATRSGRPSTTTAGPTSATAPTRSRTSQTPAPSASPSLDADVRLPAGAPTTFDHDVPAGDVPIPALAPAGAAVSASWTAPAGAGVDALMFAWTSGGDPLRSGSGFEIWIRSAASPAWRVVYAFSDRPSSGVLGVRFENGDLTGDGVPDALTFEDTGGSGACGTWRVVGLDAAGAAELFSKQTCDTDVRIVNGELHVRAAVYAPGDAHCCPSAYRTTTLRWSGQGWDVGGRTTTAA